MTNLDSKSDQAAVELSPSCYVIWEDSGEFYKDGDGVVMQFPTMNAAEAQIEFAGVVGKIYPMVITNNGEVAMEDEDLPLTMHTGGIEDE